ncbi:MAG: isoprenylcysteine carboxylmethyltransferase family protein [Actinobacteria bacterium]|nr:isoprenylcysteine carboxylmethyltransferase family protein [Actinomycetota bacterium]MBE3101272.1 isoprenylcysteine carboxylmethyltransferase family protein [Bacillota bacterium]
MKGNKTSNNRQLLIKVLIRLVLAIIVLGLIFFIPAGLIKFWEAWAYMGILFIPMIFVLIYLLKNDPELLERRMKMKEKEEPQKACIKFSLLVFFIAFIIPGFDYRFEWSKVPFIVIIIADLFIFIGYLLFFLVLKENTYASRIIEVEKGQKVISTGPYAIIRHPMYVAVLMMYVLSPLALGSYWAVLAVLPLPVLVIFRIKSEEKILRDKLPGYREYTQKVKYRLIPYIW